MVLKKVGLMVLFLFAAFVAFGYLLPKQVHVERSIIVERPASMMFTILNSYRYFSEWSPWAARDTNAEFIVSGPVSGVGARMSWIGDPRLVGSGWQEIVASKPYEQIEFKLDFDAQGVANTGFTFQPHGEATEITWSFDSNLTEGLGFVDAFLSVFCFIL